MLKFLLVFIYSIIFSFNSSGQIFSASFTKDGHDRGLRPIYLGKTVDDFNKYIIIDNVDTNYNKGKYKDYENWVKEILSFLNTQIDRNLFNKYQSLFSVDINSFYKKDSLFHIGFLEFHFKNAEIVEDLYSDYYKKRKYYRMGKIAQSVKLVNKGNVLIVLHSEYVLDQRITGFIKNYKI